MLKEPCRYFSIFLNIFYFLIYIRTIESGLNNLHSFDGTSTAEIIAGDIFFEIIEPEELEYTYRIRPAKDFGAPFNESFVLKNTPLVPVIPGYGCDLPDNIEDVKGSVVLVERGECSFKLKTLVAERSGAKAIIITDITKFNEDYFIEMIDDNSSEEANIPSGFLMGKNGIMIRNTLSKLNRKYAVINLPVNLTFTPVHEMNQPPWLGW